MAMSDFEVAWSTLCDYTKNAMAVMRNKDNIVNERAKIYTILKKALANVSKSRQTIIELRQGVSNAIDDRNKVTEQNKKLTKENQELSSSLSKIRIEYDSAMPLFRKMKELDPDLHIQAVLALGEEKKECQSQRKREQQAEYQPVKKKKSYDIDR